MASQKYGWRPVHRNYEAERRRESYHFEPADSHPLVTVVKTVEVKTVNSGEKKEDKPKVVDPLSSGGGFIDPLSVGADPLSAAALQDPLSAALFTEPSAPPPSTASRTVVGPADDANVLADDFEPWSAKKTSILSRYTTSEKISITTSFLSTEEKEKLETKAQAVSADTFKHRMEQLDDLEEGSVRETLTVNQKECVAKIDQLNRNLERAWEKEQKVKALKIAIQDAVQESTGGPDPLPS